jgi:hypothetical protein
MALDTTALVTAMENAGKTLANNVWSKIQTFAIPELKKIAVQIAAIEEAMLKRPPPYTQEGAQSLLDMQVTASVGVIVGMTTLTLIEAQNAINTMLSAVKDTVNEAIGFTLL